MKKAKTHFTLRLDEPLLIALDKLPGGTRPERVAYAVRAAIIGEHISNKLAREIAGLGERLARIETSACGGGRDPEAEKLFVQALQRIDTELDSMRVAVGAMIEHDVLPRASMDRKPQLLAALKTLRAGVVS